MVRTPGFGASIPTFGTRTNRLPRLGNPAASLADRRPLTPNYLPTKTILSAYTFGSRYTRPHHDNCCAKPDTERPADGPATYAPASCVLTNGPPHRESRSHVPAHTPAKFATPSPKKLPNSMWMANVS